MQNVYKRKDKKSEVTFQKKIIKMRKVKEKQGYVISNS